MKKRFIKEALYSVEAEQAVLCCLLFNHVPFENLLNKISERFFFINHHRNIFITIKLLKIEGMIIDLVTISEKLKEENKSQSITVVSFLYYSIKNSIEEINIVDYIEIMYKKYLLRCLTAVGSSIITSVEHGWKRTLSDLLSESEKKIFSLSSVCNSISNKPLAIRMVLAKTVGGLENYFCKSNYVGNLLFGFTKLDQLTSGLHKTDVIIVAGRPSSGKTAFAINIAEFVILNFNVPVIFFSIEMSAEQLAMRLLSSISSIPFQKIKNGFLSKDELYVLQDKISVLSHKKFLIDDSSVLSSFDIRLKVQEVVKEYQNIGLIIIDYLQLMSVNSSVYRNNRVLEISDISRTLKILAKEMFVPIIVLSQLNRSLEIRSDKRPLLSDLKDSGAIEQDADLILFIHPQDNIKKKITNINKKSLISEIIIGKQRNGPIGSIKLRFLKEFVRFVDV